MGSLNFLSALILGSRLFTKFIELFKCFAYCRLTVLFSFLCRKISGLFDDDDDDDCTRTRSGRYIRIVVECPDPGWKTAWLDVGHATHTL